MSIQVLRQEAEIDAALDRLRARELQPRRGDGDILWSLRYALRTGHRPPAPDEIKSWDVELTIDAVLHEIDPAERIVDLGAYRSAILPALARLGYRDLVGVDLDPRLLASPRADRIEYRVGDFYDMPVIADSSCAAATAVSTIEHGWRGPQLLAEVARILRTGGLFIASTDYWPDKIDTAGVTAFGLDWNIFSSDEIRRLIDDAASVGLEVRGDVDLSADERAIHWSGRDYTFLHLVLHRV